MDANGTVEPGYEAVRDAFADAQASDPGAAQLAVYRDGRLVVDLWTENWAADSAVILMSATKGMTATCAHVLAQRGLLEIDAPVARYWPEFAAAGKEEVTVRHLLTHEAGLPGWPPEAGMTARDRLDWTKATTALAGAEPLWEPGTAYSYHSVTFGYLVGEVVRRITGRSVGQFFHDEIAAPLGLSLWLGLPADEEYRVVPMFTTLPAPDPSALLGQLTSLGVNLGDPLVRTMAASLQMASGSMELLNTPEAHQAEIPAGNGIGNARALARMYAAIIGEVDGIRLLTPDQGRIAATAQTDGLGAPGELAKLPETHPLRFALGYEAARTGVPMLGEGCFGHSGAGGRLGFADPVSGTAVGYTCTNQAWVYTRGPDERWTPWTDALGAITRPGAPSRRQAIT
jgi:CubicO group peptidase (beta-lactamase class C family)